MEIIPDNGYFREFEDLSMLNQERFGDGGRTGNGAVWMLAILSTAVAASSLRAEHHDQLSPHTEKLASGPYFDGPYFSQQYMQDFGLNESQKGLYLRLVPYTRYGRHRLGEAFEPLCDGSIHSDVFGYRYDLDFRPYQIPTLPPVDPCVQLRREWNKRLEFNR